MSQQTPLLNKIIFMKYVDKFLNYVSPSFGLSKILGKVNINFMINWQQDFVLSNSVYEHTLD